jgi:hypothetical protein
MEKTTLIRCGKLYDGIKDELQSDMEILVKGKLIERVGRNLPVPEGTEMVDLTHLTVTPGMIDSHNHDSHFSQKELVTPGGRGDQWDMMGPLQVYDSWNEYACWMDEGVNPFRILKAATSTNAEICGVDSFTGSIVPGKMADIAAWPRDLIENFITIRSGYIPH